MDNNIKKENKNKALKLIDNFNKDFNTKMKNGDFSFLINLYENFIIYNRTDITEKNEINKLVELGDKIESIFNQEQKKIFDEWSKIQDEFFSELQLQSFVYGYCTCKQLEMESNMSRD